ncbi:hypothetical protein AB833_26260 [Chromatiales bacterium (ex Bugula neritina AB1)]|nr:hypothetical protein AB833_26260 [Chromatiales bacterium (ex Bugula neritina AB1)]
MSKNRSITRRLIWLIVLPVILLVIVGAGLAARMASQSVNDLYDQQMQANAGVLLSFILYESIEHEQEEDDDEDEPDEDEVEELLEITEAINAEHGLPVNFRLIIGEQTRFESRSVASFPACSTGFNIIMPAHEKLQNQWRCYRQEQTLLTSNITVTVEVFESLHQRNLAIRSLLAATFSPLILLPLLLAGVTYWAVSSAMRTLRNVSSDISNRSVDNLERLSLEQQPTELLPVATSVNQLLDGIERSLKREKQFTDDAAHELRTPLTSIKMLEQLLRRDNKDPALLPHLDGLRDGVDKSTKLIEQLLGFARLQTAKSLQLNPINLSGVLHTELGLLAPQLVSKQLEVSIEEDRYSRPVYANESAMALLIRNLLSNACKFSDSAGTIYIFLDDSFLIVEDDGPGIDEENRERVFDRFYRAPGTKDKPGSGLGLALAKWVADAHKFELYVQPPVRGTGASIILRYHSPE